MLQRTGLSIGLLLAFAAAAPAPVDFEKTSIADPAGAPLETGIWSPAGGGAGAPLVVISHGSGGDYRNHEDTARALAEAGFVVAAVTHSGDNRHDRSAAAAIWERPRHLRLLVDHMLGAWPRRASLDRRKIGAFGFSAGGFAVLVAAGGVPRLEKVREHCRANPAFFDCRLSGGGAGAPARIAWVRDPRVKAVVAASPALGFTFGKRGLAGVRVPVQLWRAGSDEVLPHPFYAEAVRKALPRRPDYRVVASAGHFDFLQPCPPPLAKARPDLCRSAQGFDRAAFHAALNSEIVRFFRAHFGAD